MKVSQLREILNVFPDDFDVMVDNNQAERINVDFKFGYIFLKPYEEKEDEEEGDIGEIYENKRKDKI